MADNAELSDLVVSWEAWRPPRVGFDPVAGLAPQTYALTARCYDGSVRCLSDAILDRPWICYPLEFPTVPHAADELLYVTLLLADAVARHTIGSILEKRIDDTRNQPDDYQDEKLEDWLELRDKIQAQHLPEDPIGEILQGKVGYHLLLRSCITMTLLAVDWANVRIHQRGGLGEPARIRISPESLPEFFDNLMHRRRLSTLLALPSAVHWLTQHQTVIPARSHKLLDEVGLLQRENGLPMKRSFDNRKQSPYGVLGEHLIY